MRIAVIRIVDFASKAFLRKPLFRNYFSSLMRYGLMRYGLISSRDILIKCFDGAELHINRYVFSLIIYLYVNNIVAGIDCLDRVVVTVNGSLIPIDELSLVGWIALEALRRGWAYNSDGRYWFRNDVKFKHMYGPIIETFDLDQYGFIDVSDRVVVDIGAFVGDSAIYFALRGARRIYAIEPHPDAYTEMLENIKLNNMGDKIIPMNVALGSMPGRIKIPNVDISTTVGTYHGLRSDGDVEVPMITLEQFMRDYGVEPDVLKMDCEGCEFDVILNDYEHVRLFRELVFEYHSHATNRSVMELINVLKRDFECKLINEEIYKNYHRDFTRDEFGMLYCVKSSFK